MNSGRLGNSEIIVISAINTAEITPPFPPPFKDKDLMIRRKLGKLNLFCWLEIPVIYS